MEDAFVRLSDWGTSMKHVAVEGKVHARSAGMSADSADLPLRVLVAEDDDDMRAVIAETLRRDGHEVTEARDGADLLVCLRDGIRNAHEPSVIVTDVLMPHLSGIGVLSARHRA